MPMPFDPTIDEPPLRKPPRHPTPRLLAPLWGLRIDGPCSIAYLSRRTGRDRESVYWAVYKMRGFGWAARLGEASYDITDAGRAVLEASAPDPAESRQLEMFSIGGTDDG
jgi:hypothetical protein